MLRKITHAAAGALAALATSSALLVGGPALAQTGVIATPDAPAAIGPYSQAIAVRDMVFVSGQIGLDADGKLAAPDTVGQARQALRNIEAILKAAGLSLDDVTQVQVYVVDLNEFAAVNEVYAGFFKRPPARATVQVARLPKDARIEIAAIAVRPATP